MYENIDPRNITTPCVPKQHSKHLFDILSFSILTRNSYDRIGLNDNENLMVLGVKIKLSS